MTLKLARAQVGQGLVIKFTTVTHNSIGVIEDHGHISLFDILVGKGTFIATFANLVEPDTSQSYPST